SDHRTGSIPVLGITLTHSMWRSRKQMATSDV
ncbi:hypothetical protein ABH902_003141, partial [Enterococcus sp. UD-01]